MSHAATHVAVYVRISSDPFNLLAGVGRQETDCRRLAEVRWPGHEVRVYTDNDVSASRFSKRPRPGFQELTAAITRGEVYAVIGWNFDRLFRRPAELETFLDLCDRLKFTRALTAQGDVDLTTDDGRLHARIMTAVAAKESDDKSRRIRRSLLDRRERGQHHHGKVVYGYRLVDGEPIMVPTAAKVVRDAARRFLGGEPLSSIARRMPEGAPRTPGGVRMMLLSPALTGRVGSALHGGVAGSTQQWRPILDDTTAAEIRAKLKAPDRVRSAAHGRRRWWLAGLVKCGLCGASMRAQQGGSGSNARSFTCSRFEGGCGRMSVRCDLLQAHVEIAILDSVVAQMPVESAMEPANPGLNGMALPHNHGTPPADRLAELAALYVSDQITQAEWLAARGAITSHITHDPLPQVHLRPVADLPRRWRQMTVDQRHEQAARLIERVSIQPRQLGGPRWQPDRVAIDWRQ